MRLDRVLKVVQTMRERQGRRRGPSRALTYQPPTPTRYWTWDTATPHERACFVRENRRLGIMDWDLCELFNLTREGLSEIARGKDWRPDHTPTVGQ